MWAQKFFPSMNDFYTGKLGFIIKIGIFAIVLISYTLVRKMQENDESRTSTHTLKKKWHKALYQKRYIKWIVDKYVPAPHTRKHSELTRLLKDTNSPLTMEWFQLNRLLLFVGCFIASMAMFVYLHTVTIDHVLASTSFKQSVFGKMSPEEQLAAQKINEFDKSIINQLKGVRENLTEEIAELVNKAYGNKSNPNEITKTVSRINLKITTINNEYLKWWEVLISIGAGLIAYRFPIWILQFQRRMREMEMKLEVDQMHAIIAMLCEIERISVESILEWMERFSTIFKTPLKTCLMNFESGPQKAFEELKLEAPFVPFVRTIKKLERSLERIPIKQSFDDLETERNYYQEERKEEYERILNEKAEWGRLIGFAPASAVVFFYLIAPFIYVSVVDMMNYYEQLSKIN